MATSEDSPLITLRGAQARAISQGGEARLAYVTRVFPKLSETFILNEILELERLGQSLTMFSIRPPDEELVHASYSRLQAEVKHLWGHDPRIVNKLPRWRASYSDKPPPGIDPLLWPEFLQYTTDLGVSDRYVAQSVMLTYVLRAAGITHIHAHFANMPTLVSMLASRLMGITYSVTAHARDIYLTDQRELTECIRNAEFVTTCTMANKEHLAALVDEATAERIHLVYHGVDVERFSPRERAPRSGRLRILSVGRLVEKKGFPTLLQACGLLRDQGLDFECQIIGEGGERELMENTIRELNLQELISMPGAMSQERLVEEYHEADVFCLPCQVLENGDRDGIPNVLLEAMAVGLPVVSTAISGMPELVTSGVSGYLVTERDPVALAESLSALIKEPAHRERVGAAGREAVIRSFDASKHIHRMAELLASVTVASDVS